MTSPLTKGGVTVCESLLVAFNKRVLKKTNVESVERGRMSLVAKICGEEKRRLARQHATKLALLHSAHTLTYCTVLTQSHTAQCSHPHILHSAHTLTHTHTHTHTYCTVLTTLTHARYVIMHDLFTICYLERKHAFICIFFVSTVLRYLVL